MTNSESVRQQMVEQQVRTWDVFDPDVLRTVSAVPRELYVPARFRECAYADAEVPLAHGQCMLRPSICGRILQALDLDRSDEILEIGTGTGYLTHCLATLAGSVTSIDLFPEFIEAARDRLEDADVDNVRLECMDASRELPSGQYDAIAITAAVAGPVDRYVEALKPGGRLFVVIGEPPVMTGTLVTRQDDGSTSTEELFETRIPAMVTADKRRRFSF